MGVAASRAARSGESASSTSLGTFHGGDAISRPRCVPGGRPGPPRISDAQRASPKCATGRVRRGDLVPCSAPHCAEQPDVKELARARCGPAPDAEQTSGTSVRRGGLNWIPGWLADLLWHGNRGPTGASRPHRRPSASISSSGDTLECVGAVARTSGDRGRGWRPAQGWQLRRARRSRPLLRRCELARFGRRWPADPSRSPTLVRRPNPPGGPRASGSCPVRVRRKSAPLMLDRTRHASDLADPSRRRQGQRFVAPRCAPPSAGRAQGRGDRGPNARFRLFTQPPL